MTEIAIFPIPGCVTFPGTIFPLHVFEPRYRQMVRQCLADGQLLGICHTQKLIRPGRENLSLADSLQSNQATYAPCEVFSAGVPELEEELDDGRLIVRVPLQQRYRLLRERQTLPYRIGVCEPWPDQDVPADDLAALPALQEKILRRMQALFHRETSLIRLLNDPVWRDLDALEFSFRLFGVIRFEAERQQEILEDRSPRSRLERALALLNE